MTTEHTTIEPIEQIRRHIDVHRAQLEYSTEAARQAAAELDAIADRFPGTSAEQTMLAASATQREAAMLCILLLDVLRHASELSSTSRVLDLVEAAQIAERARGDLTE